jgi:hypothetical protein
MNVEVMANVSQLPGIMCGIEAFLLLLLTQEAVEGGGENSPNHSFMP